jgi:hypothetical protein
MEEIISIGEGTNSILIRFLALATMKLGNVDGALKWSEEAYKIDASKKSLFSLFQASLELTLKNPESTKDTVSDILKQLLSRHDFDVEDLYSFGKAAHDKGIDSVALDILDKLAEIIAGQIHSKKSLDRPKIVSVPFGNILQNAAQLAFQHFTKINPLDQPHLPKGDNADKTIPYADKFLKYGALFLEVGQKMNSENASMIGSIDIFQWFYNMR